MRIRCARPADALALARVHVNSWHTTYRGILPDRFLAEQSLAHRRQQWERHLNDPHRATCDLVAADEGGRIVAFASAGPRRSGHPGYQGELFTLYVLQAYQRRGVGRRLMTHVCKRLLRRRIRSLLVCALKDNPARAFYEAIGGKLLGEQPFFLGEEVVPEVTYGWKDLALLVHRLQEASAVVGWSAQQTGSASAQG